MGTLYIPISAGTFLALNLRSSLAKRLRRKEMAMDAEFCYGGRRKSRCSENQLECRPFRTIYIPLPGMASQFPPANLPASFTSSMPPSSLGFGGQRAAAKAAGRGNLTRAPQQFAVSSVRRFVLSLVRNFVRLLIGKSKSFIDSKGAPPLLRTHTGSQEKTLVRRRERWEIRNAIYS